MNEFLIQRIKKFCANMTDITSEKEGDYAKGINMICNSIKSLIEYEESFQKTKESIHESINNFAQSTSECPIRMNIWNSGDKDES